MPNSTSKPRSNIDHRLIADRVLSRSDDLRSIPGDLHAACELARAMLQEQGVVDKPERAEYNNIRHVDAILAMIQGTALYLSGQVYDIIGEDDSDLPVVAAEPNPTNEESDQDEDDAFFVQMSGGRLQ